MKPSGWTDIWTRQFGCVAKTQFLFDYGKNLLNVKCLDGMGDDVIHQLQLDEDMSR